MNLFFGWRAYLFVVVIVSVEKLASQLFNAISWKNHPHSTVVKFLRIVKWSQHLIFRVEEVENCGRFVCGMLKNLLNCENRKKFLFNISNPCGLLKSGLCWTMSETVFHIGWNAVETSCFDTKNSLHRVLNTVLKTLWRRSLLNNLSRSWCWIFKYRCKMCFLSF